MRKQEAIEQARKEIIECVENGQEVHNYSIECDYVVFFGADNNDEQFVNKIPFEPEMIPDVTRCEVWNHGARPQHPTIKVFAGYTGDRANFHVLAGGTVRHANYEIIPPDAKDKEIERLRGLLTSLVNRKNGCLRFDAHEVSNCVECRDCNNTTECSKTHNKRIINGGKND